MALWRLALSLLLLLLLLPLFGPVPSLADPAVWSAAALPRLLVLARNTVLLVALTLFLCVPAGTLLAILLERTDLPGQRLLRLLLLLPLFVPLPLFLSGWQGVLGPDGWFPLALWSGQLTTWAPWAQGLGPAAWIHAVAGLPWVVLFAGRGLRSVEATLEESALLEMPVRSVLLHITLPRAAPAVIAGALCVALQAAGEITITDLMQVRTFAEEVYTQLVVPETASAGDPLGRSLAGSLFAMVPAVAFVLWLVRQPSLTAGVGFRPPPLLCLGRWRWLVTIVLGGLAIALLAAPTAGLVSRAGATPTGWSAEALVVQLLRVARHDAELLWRTLLTCAASGFLCAVLAFLVCWLVREAPRFATFVVILLALAWAVPGPVLGFGLKMVLRALLEITGWPRWLSVPLYYGPSSLPQLWVNVIRFLPVAAALVWPVMRRIPQPLLDADRLDGAAPWREAWFTLRPVALPAMARAALVAAVLSLGELSAGKLVSTPGAETFAEAVWTQMHYGVTPDLAARCVLLLLVVGVGGICAMSRR